MERKGRGERARNSALMLTLPAEYRNVAYYGMGPGETYSDFTSGAHMGLFGFDAHTALQPYFNPQESGARTGVQAAAVTDAAGFGLCLAGNGFMLSALPYTPHEVENARPPVRAAAKGQNRGTLCKRAAGRCGRQHLGRPDPMPNTMWRWRRAKPSASLLAAWAAMDEPAGGRKE